MLTIHIFKQFWLAKYTNRCVECDGIKVTLLSPLFYSINSKSKAGKHSLLTAMRSIATVLITINSNPGDIYHKFLLTITHAITATAHKQLYQLFSVCFRWNSNIAYQKCFICVCIAQEKLTWKDWVASKRQFNKLYY